jgi:hypothetical protein
LLSPDLGGHFRFVEFRQLRVKDPPNFGGAPADRPGASSAVPNTPAATVPGSATASKPPICETALLMPEAVPACRFSTALITVVVNGATVTAMPSPSTAIAGEKVA